MMAGKDILVMVLVVWCAATVFWMSVYGLHLWLRAM
jgi:hypothetical protein